MRPHRRPRARICRRGQWWSRPIPGWPTPGCCWVPAPGWALRCPCGPSGRPGKPGAPPGPPRCSVGPEMPLGVAAAAASAPALVRASARAATAAVRRPLHRVGGTAAGTGGGAYGASWYTASCGGAGQLTVVGAGRGGSAGSGRWAVTAPLSDRSLCWTCGSRIGRLARRPPRRHEGGGSTTERPQESHSIGIRHAKTPRGRSFL